MTAGRKQAVPVSDARRFLEPGPVVLISSLQHGRANIMTAGWHQILEFTPSLVSCLISSGNQSFEMIRETRECVINVPTTALTNTAVSIGNTSGAEVDKFDHFGLTRADSALVAAPPIGECYANLECRLHDDALVERYNLFIFEVVAIQAVVSPRFPQTLHYRGDGEFMLSGKTISRRHLFRPGML